MRPHVLISGLALIPSAITFPTTCNLIGADLPQARDVASNPHIRAAAETLTDALHEALRVGETLDNQTTSFSINIFSTESKEPFYKFHYTSPSTKTAEYGTQKVGQDTVYRIASITKLFAVYLLLIEDGDVHFNEPITKYIPELADAKNGDPLDSVKWEDVTIGAIASQIAGLGRDVASESIEFDLPEWSHKAKNAFPSLKSWEIPKCGNVPKQRLCSREEFLEELHARPPVFFPNAAPAYSNPAFVLLGFAIEAIAAKNATFEELLIEKLLKPLNLKSTTFTKPLDDSVGVIPGTPSETEWDVDLGPHAADGAIYSTPYDLSLLGHSILTSALLPPTLTRRWLKPHTHTASPYVSVGAPWEIYRGNLGSRVVDLYTKGGDFGDYSTALVLSPDYNAGVSILAAGEYANEEREILINLAGSTVLAAFETAARAQAAADYSGRYVAHGLNSSLTLTVDERPGMRVSEWVSNGTDMFDLLADGIGVRLFPAMRSGKRQSFRAVFWPETDEGDEDEEEEDCEAWLDLDGFMYGRYGIDEFVFELDEEGKPVEAELRAFRVKMPKIAAELSEDSVEKTTPTGPPLRQNGDLRRRSVRAKVPLLRKVKR